MAFCSKCGAALKEGAKFCSQCGKPADTASAAVVSPSPAPVPVQQASPSPVFTPSPVSTPVQSPAPSTDGAARKKSGMGKGCLIGCGVVLALALIVGVILAIVLVPRIVAGGRILGNVAALAVDGANMPSDAPANVRFGVKTSDKFGFSLEVPDDWEMSMRNGSPVFHGPDGGEQSDVTINLQFIFRTQDTTLEGQASDYAEQVKKAGNSSTTSQKGAFHGFPAVYMLSSFTMGSVDYKQVQMMVERERYYYWISYTAPRNLFDKYLYVLNRAAATFKFIPIRQTGRYGDRRSDGLDGLREAGQKLAETLDNILSPR